MEDFEKVYEGNSESWNKRFEILLIKIVAMRLAELVTELPIK
jgi:hypothetical protein